jgi:hypothetical protein
MKKHKKVLILAAIFGASQFYVPFTLAQTDSTGQNTQTPQAAGNTDTGNTTTPTANGAANQAAAANNGAAANTAAAPADTSQTMATQDTSTKTTTTNNSPIWIALAVILALGAIAYAVNASRGKNTSSNSTTYNDKNGQTTTVRTDTTRTNV